MKRRRRDRAAKRRAARTVTNALTRGLAASVSPEPQPRLKKARRQSILERLASRHLITPRQRDAGDRLSIDHRIASGSRPRLVMDYLALGHGKPPKRQGFTDNDGPAQLDARRRFEAAIADLGRDLAPVVIHAVIADQPVGDWAKLYRRPCAFGMALLKQGLDALIAHYQKPAAERLRRAAAAAPRHTDVPLVAPLPVQVNGKVPKTPIMPSPTGYQAFLAAQAVGRGIDDDTLIEALGYAEQRGWTNGHAAPEDAEMVAATRQMIALARNRDEAAREVRLFGR